MSAGKITLIAVGAFVGIFAIGIVAQFGVLGERWIMAPFRGAVEEREITNQGQYRIQSYEQFYRWREEIGEIDTALATLPTSGMDKREETECRGLLARRANLVGKYNSASQAERTQGQWKDPTLPIALHQQNTRSCN